MITPLGWTTDDHLTWMIPVNINSPRTCRRSWQPPGLLGNTAAAAATDPAGSKTGGRHPCPGSPAACGEHVAAQHDALKLAERAHSIPRARTRVRRMRTADWRVRIRWICCCDCCCLINQSCLGVLRGPPLVQLCRQVRIPSPCVIIMITHWLHNRPLTSNKDSRALPTEHYDGAKRSRSASGNDR